MAFGFGAGLAPRAPGTWGTLVGLPLFLLLIQLPALLYWGLVAVLFLLGIWFCGITGKALGVQDHGGIVWDEIVAFLMVLPFAHPSGWGYAIAFALFRLFDIWKPFPIGWLDARIGGGFGVMLDDVLAAVYAIGILYGLNLWLR
jgi:phosphatidylglycerophosphatase A